MDGIQNEASLLKTVANQQKTIAEQGEVIVKQQGTIRRQSDLIADLMVTLENWETVADYDGTELKKRAMNLH